MAVLLVSGFMNLIDVSIVNVALPSMQAALGASDSQIEWVVAAYILVFALGLLPFGRAGDIHGRRRVFILGVAIFTFGSALCGLAPNMNALIAARDHPLPAPPRGRINRWWRGIKASLDRSLPPAY